MSLWRIGLLLLLVSCHKNDNTAVKKEEQPVNVARLIAGCSNAADCEAQCTRRVASACVEAGRLYEFGHAGTRDARRALPLYERACTLGFSGGCFNVAVLLESGQAGPRDEKRAAQLFAQVCQSGSKTACARAAALKDDNAH
jgi:TPR repeat protein